MRSRSANRTDRRPPFHLRRKHPEAKVGDTFGPYRVTKTFARGHKGRSDERVAWVCTCGREGASYVFNLRKVERCHHVNAAGQVTAYGARLTNGAAAGARASR